LRRIAISTVKLAPLKPDKYLPYAYIRPFSLN
jgi:hypothetical protein